MNQVMALLAMALCVLIGAFTISALYHDRCESGEQFNRRGTIYVCKRVQP